MKNPQIISIAGENADTVMAIWGEYVIDNTTQVAIATGPITVDIDLFDVTTGAAVATISSQTMTYNTTSQFWTIPLSGLIASLTDRHKYVGKVSEHTPYPKNMRAFFLDEFAIDNNSFEESLMRLPFEISSSYVPGEMWIVWSDTIGGTAQYKAPAYEGGTGTTFAKDPSRVTHRGAVEPV